MTLWDTNLERLRQRQPGLAAQFEAVPMHNVRLMTHGEHMVGQTWDVATQQWVALCHPENPVAEAEADAAALWTKDARVFVCFGLGLGYFPVALAKRLLPYQRMAIFDPNPMHYKAMMYCVDASILQGDRHVETFVGDDLLRACEQWWLSLQSQEKLHIGMPMRSGFTNACDVATYEALLAKTGDMLRYHAVGLATWRQFGPHIGYSDWGNLPEYFLTPGFQELKDRWAGKPAVCVAAGPSLRKNIALLRNPDYRKKVAVISVGTTYVLLQALGIQPDIVCTIDFQRLNWTDQFVHVPLDDAPALVYLHSTYPATVRRWPGPRFVGLNASDTTTWMAQFAEPKATAGHVQSVAHLNVVVAQMLGASPIILLGQDLSMPMDEHHALGARAQDLAPQEALESYIEMPGYDGKPVWSRHSMLSMKLVFEQIAAAITAQGQQVLNCTEGGLALQGVQNLPFAEVLEALPTQDARLSTVCQQVCAEYKPVTRIDEALKDIAALLASLDTLEVAAQEILATVPQWEAAEGEEKTQLFQAIVRHDAQFGKEGLAFGQIAIRRFEIIELVSAIPPAPDTPEEDLRALNVHRLQTVAVALQADIPTVRGIIQRAHKRLLDVQALDAENAVPTWAMFARQSFAALERYAQQHALSPDMAAALAWHQQRYGAIAQAARTSPRAKRLEQRAQHMLQRHADHAYDLGWKYCAPRKD